jgi:hypothetical protein
VFELRVVETKPALTSCLWTAFSASGGAALLVLVHGRSRPSVAFAGAKFENGVLVERRDESTSGDTHAA